MERGVLSLWVLCLHLCVRCVHKDRESQHDMIVFSNKCQMLSSHFFPCFLFFFLVSFFFFLVSFFFFNKEDTKCFNSS